MAKFEITLVVEAPDLSTAISRFLWDEFSGEANPHLKEVTFAHPVE